MGRLLGIYVIEHVATGRLYVGKSVDVRRRVSNHLSGLTKKCAFLSAAIRKYGRDAFVWRLVESCSSEVAATERESHWIASLGTMAPHGFNLTRGGEGVSGLKHSRDARVRMAERRRGRHHSAETREKMSVARREFYRTEEGHASQRARLCARAGYRHSDETRAKMSASNTGKKCSPATVERMRAAKRHTSAETRERMRAASVRMWADPEIRARILAGRAEARRGS